MEVISLADIKNFHLSNSQLALTSAVFLEHVRTALLAKGADRSRKLLFLRPDFIGLLQNTNMRVCGTGFKTNVKEIKVDRRTADFQHLNSTFS